MPISSSTSKKYLTSLRRLMLTLLICLISSSIRWLELFTERSSDLRDFTFKAAHIWHFPLLHSDFMIESKYSWTTDIPQGWSLRLETFGPALESRHQTKSNTSFSRAFKLPKHEHCNVCKFLLYDKNKTNKITCRAWQDHCWLYPAGQCWRSPPPQSSQPPPPASSSPQPTFCLLRGEAGVLKLLPGLSPDSQQFEDRAFTFLRPLHPLIYQLTRRWYQSDFWGTHIVSFWKKVKIR